MGKKNLSFALVIFAATSFAICSKATGTERAPEEDIRAIHRCYAEYRLAILNQDADKAYQCVDKNTRVYYDRCAELAKFASAQECEKLPLIDRIMVYMIRATFKPGQMNEITGEVIFKTGVKKGWISREEVIKNKEITDLKIGGDKAVSKNVADGQVTPFGFHFNRESEVWKIDLPSVLPVANLALKKMLKDGGISDDQLLSIVSESSCKMKYDANLWNPPLKKEAAPDQK